MRIPLWDTGKALLTPEGELCRFKDYEDWQDEVASHASVTMPNGEVREYDFIELTEVEEWMST